MRTTPRILAARFGLLLGGCVLALGLGEVTARLVPLPDSAPLTLGISSADVPGLFSWDRNYGVIATPGFEGQVAHPMGTIPVRINSLGLRGPECDPQAAERRWLMLGDSFVMGLQVTEEQTISAAVSRALDQPVLNGGMTGFDTLDALARHSLLSTKLEVYGTILVFYTGNDIGDNARAEPRTLPSPPPDYQLRPVKIPAAKALLASFTQRSMLLGQLRLLLQRIGPSSLDPAGWEDMTASLVLFTEQGGPQLAQAMGPTRAALTKLRERSEAAGQPLLVAVAPPIYAVDASRFQATLRQFGMGDLSPSLEAPQQAVLQFLAEEGIEACDLTPGLRSSQRRGEEPYLFFDGHWSPAGHAAAAAQLVDCLASFDEASPASP